MKHFICLLVLGSLFICAACASGQDLSRFDLSTDEGVTAAREAASGKKLDEYSKGCIRRSMELPKAVVVGSFAHDYGCSFQGVFLGLSYFEEGDARLSKSALDFLGWQGANQAERERLALLWVEKGLLAFLTVLAERDADFKDGQFQPPRVVSQENGEVVVTLWIRKPPGMTPERYYELREYTFSKDGELTRTANPQSLVGGRPQPK